MVILVYAGENCFMIIVTLISTLVSAKMTYVNQYMYVHVVTANYMLDSV